MNHLVYVGLGQLKTLISVMKSRPIYYSLPRLRRLSRGSEPRGRGEHRRGGVAPLRDRDNHEQDLGQHRHHLEQAQPGGQQPSRGEAGRTGDVHQPGKSREHPPARIHRR